VWDWLKENVDYQQCRFLISLFLAAVLGFAIGVERKFRAKEAGMRTHTVVCFGSCLMMLISVYGFEGSKADPARLAAQIVAGVGFLGAGIIVYRKNEVHGLTTAAGVWTTAGIGMACGGGMWLLAIGATILLIFFQWLFHRNWKFFKHKKHYIVRIVFEQRTDEREQIKQIFETDRYNSLVIDREGDKLVYRAKLYTDIEYSSSQLNEIIETHPFIYTLEREDDN
jgi:putative Mg2+ transporter-C (MgtC) family protein